MLFAFSIVLSHAVKGDRVMESSLASARLRDVRGALVSIGRHLTDLEGLPQSSEMAELLVGVRARAELMDGELSRLVVELAAYETRKAVRS